MVEIAEATEHDEKVAYAQELMEMKDFRAVIYETDDILEKFKPNIPAVTQAALLQGRAIMTDLILEMQKNGEMPSKKRLEKALEAYQLCQTLDPKSQECEYELMKLLRFIQALPPPSPPESVRKADIFDVIVIGAGAAGVGTALMLTDTFGLDKAHVLVLERGGSVGESFRQWPEEMRFISPSFNQQGWTKSFDLNSVAIGTSPAYSLHTQHPSGKEYASYLEALTEKCKLNVRTDTEVLSVQDISVEGENEGDKKIPLFSVQVQSLKKDNDENDGSKKVQSLTARYIVWAAGEFQYPKGQSKTISKSKIESESQEEKKSDDTTLKHQTKSSRPNFPGEELCQHNSTVQSWAKLPGEEYLIIGGYESGVDASVNLSKAGKKCKILASTPCWSVKTSDPSAELAPYTAARLRDVLAPSFSPQPQLMAPLQVMQVEKMKEGDYRVTAVWKGLEEESNMPNLRNIANRNVHQELQGEEGDEVTITTPNPPILCTGFEGSVSAAASHLFKFSKVDQEEADDDKKEDEEETEEVEVEEVEAPSKKTKKGGCLDGAPLLTRNDESTVVPGVFLVGPTVSHGTLSFCFVYKFRQRFAIVAKAICEGLGMDTRAAVKVCQNSDMFLQDFSCCGDTCGDVC